jgi:enoyl-CoA hydratase
VAVDTVIENQVAIVTMNRSEALNAFNIEQLIEFIEVFDSIRNNPRIRCIVLTGAGDRAFAAGADIKEMAEMDGRAGLEFGRMGQAATRAIEELPQPVIAAVNGYALGGGCEIAIAADIRYCSENAIFAQPEVSLGIPPGWGGSQRLPRVVGPGFAAEMILSGRRVNAEEALKVGLVNAVFEQATLLEQSIELAQKVASNGPYAVRSAKRLIRLAFNETNQLGLKTEVAAFGDAFAGSEQKVGMRAFVSKKPAQFVDTDS